MTGNVATATNLSWSSWARHSLADACLWKIIFTHSIIQFSLQQLDVFAQFYRYNVHIAHFLMDIDLQYVYNVDRRHLGKKTTPGNRGRDFLFEVILLWNEATWEDKHHVWVRRCDAVACRLGSLGAFCLSVDCSRTLEVFLFTMRFRQVRILPQERTPTRQWMLFPGVASCYFNLSFHREQIDGSLSNLVLASGIELMIRWRTHRNAMLAVKDEDLILLKCEEKHLYLTLRS